MINIFVYVYKKDEQTGEMSWQLRKGVYPAFLNKRLDEELDSGVITFYTKTPELLPPLTMVKVELNDQNWDEENDTDYNTDKRYYLGNDSYVKVNSRLYEHTFNLVEPTKLLEGVKIDGRRISHPEDEAQRKSLYDVLKELLAVTPLRTTQEAASEMAGTRKAPYVVTDDAAVVAALQGVKSPEFRCDSQTTLWECLNDIAAMIDAIPRLTANAAETAFDTITFDFVNETNRVVESMSCISESMSFEEGQYCSAIETQAENIVESDNESASVVFPSANGWTTPRTEDVKREDDNCVLILPQNIEQLIHVYANVGGAFINYDKIIEGAPTVTSNFSLDMLVEHGLANPYLDIKKYCVEFKEWQTEKIQSSSETSLIAYKNNSFYWTQGENTLMLLGERYKVSALFSVPVYKELLAGVVASIYNNNPNYFPSWTAIENGRQVFYRPNGNVQRENMADIRNWRLRVEYIPTNSNAKVRAVKTNKTNVEFVQSYNQRAQVNDSESLGRAMKGTVEKMGIDTLKLMQVHKTLDGMLDVGDVYMYEGEAYIVTVVDWEILSHRFTACVYELSKNWSLLSRYVGINRRFRSWNIPNDVLERNLSDRDYCEITREDGTVAGQSDPNVRLDNAPQTEFLSVLATNLATDDEITTCWIFKDEYTTDNRTNLDGVMVPASTFAFGKSTVFYARTLDNLSAGKRMQTETIDGSSSDSNCCVDTYYCNDDGTLQEMTIMLGANIRSNLGATDSDAAALVPFARRGKPSSSSIADYYVNYPNGAKFSQKYAVAKQPAEQLNFVYQIHFVTDLPDIVIGNMLAQNNPLIKNMSSRTFKVWSLKKKLPNGVIKLNGYYGAEFAGNTFSYYISTAAQGGQIRSVTYYKDETIVGWAITDENDNLYIAQNSNEEISATNAIILKLRHKYHGQ